MEPLHAARAKREEPTFSSVCEAAAAARRKHVQPADDKPDSPFGKAESSYVLVRVAEQKHMADDALEVLKVNARADYEAEIANALAQKEGIANPGVDAQRAFNAQASVIVDTVDRAINELVPLRGRLW